MQVMQLHNTAVPAASFTVVQCCYINDIEARKETLSCALLTHLYMYTTFYTPA